MKRNKPSVKHIPETIVTKYVAMPCYPPFKAGVRLEAKTFEPNEAQVEKLGSFKEALEVCKAQAEAYISNSLNIGEKFWLMTKGIKTSRVVKLR